MSVSWTSDPMRVSSSRRTAVPSPIAHQRGRNQRVARTPVRKQLAAPDDAAAAADRQAQAPSIPPPNQMPERDPSRYQRPATDGVRCRVESCATALPCPDRPLRPSRRRPSAKRRLAQSEREEMPVPSAEYIDAVDAVQRQSEIVVVPPQRQAKPPSMSVSRRAESASMIRVPWAANGASLDHGRNTIDSRNRAIAPATSSAGRGQRSPAVVGPVRSTTIARSGTDDGKNATSASNVSPIRRALATLPSGDRREIHRHRESRRFAVAEAREPSLHPSQLVALRFGEGAHRHPAVLRPHRGRIGKQRLAGRAPGRRRATQSSTHWGGDARAKAGAPSARIHMSASTCLHGNLRLGQVHL
jgi:hypothetical protein